MNNYANIDFKSKIKKLFFSKNALSVLMLINICFFILIAFIGIVGFLFNINNSIQLFTNYLILPSDLSQFFSNPFTLFTYQFVHIEFWHILFNMIMLWFGGQIFLQFLNSKKLVYTYIFGGIVGGLFYISAYNLFPVFENINSQSQAMGASAAVLAIIVSAAAYRPNFEIHLFLFGKVKIKWFVLILVAIDILSIDKGNPGGHIAHIGGAFWGLIAGVYYRNPFLKDFSNKKPKRKMKYAYSKGPISRPKSDEQYNALKIERQKKIDTILDKISKSGYENLSKEEKEFLFKSHN